MDIMSGRNIIGNREEIKRLWIRENPECEDYAIEKT